MARSMNAKLIFKLVLTLCAVQLAVMTDIGWAQKVRVDLIVRNVQGWYDNLSDFQADFQQKTFSQTLQATSEARGKIYFKKPHLIKWDYEFPEKQVYIIDQENFWWYVPEDTQVVKKKAKSVLQDAPPLSFLAGIGDLQKSFIITLPEKDKKDKTDKIGEALFLNLTPRQELVSMKQMQLKLKAKTYQVLGIVVVDPYGNTNDIDFIHIQINQGLKDEIFHFTPPKGVDIVNGDAEGIGRSSNPF